MKRIFVSLSVIAAVGAIVVGATTAYFSDTETSSGNTFTAGTLDLAVDGENPATTTAKFNFGPLAPGATGTVTYDLENVGNLPGDLSLSSFNCTSSEGTNPESETGDTANPGELCDNIYVELAFGGTIFATGTLADVSGTSSYNVSLASSATTTFTIYYAVDKDGQGPLGKDVGNDIQGDIATTTLEFELAQTPGQ